ncbi:MAG: trifunctional transcriptional regulator/proline dehydrogenase/L-glutamate gamma-semialdehyde dehydrogenase, partial [Zoogloea sp.]|nr:trifunctional transcriptional regulator/proline dehydrogenase/L-glutamate gamma-semialdehyde dehydrogenase [Zoogloea sp.]
KTITERLHVGNTYVNRNMIGAVVGVQPFGGEGLSGTGPKAGGPLMLQRLALGGGVPLPQVDRPQRPALEALAGFLAGGHSGCPPARLDALSESLSAYQAESLAGVRIRLNGPTGEDNLLSFRPRGVLVGLAHDDFGRLHQMAAALATGNRLRLPRSPAAQTLAEHLPHSLAEQIELADEWAAEPFDGVLADLPPAEVDALRRRLAALPGPILPLLTPAPRYPLARLVVERAVSVNTAASGGNAALMSLADC